MMMMIGDYDDKSKINVCLLFSKIRELCNHLDKSTKHSIQQMTQIREHIFKTKKEED